jgi:hypothetical protein
MGLDPPRETISRDQRGLGPRPTHETRVLRGSDPRQSRVEASSVRVGGSRRRVAVVLATTAPSAADSLSPPVRVRWFCAPDAAGRTRPAGRRRPRTATNLCDVVSLAQAVAIGGNPTTGAQRIDIFRGDASHLSSNSAAANPPTAAVRLSCNDRLRPEAMGRIIEPKRKWLSTETLLPRSTRRRSPGRGGDARCKRGAQQAGGGLAAAEFDDRCDPPPHQKSIRCAPVATPPPMATACASKTTSQRFVVV